MKFCLYCFIFLIPYLSFSQTYTSPITQHFPTGEIEFINRTISFDGKEFLIESETPFKAFHVQKWIVKEYSEMDFPIHGLSHFYVCESIDSKYTTYILIPNIDPIEYIEIIQPQQLNFDPIHVRFLVD